MGRYRQQFTKQAFHETMGVHNCYKETFTLWAVTTKETKVRGSDHLGEFLTSQGKVSHGGRDQVHLQYTMGEVDMSARLHAGQQDS